MNIQKDEHELRKERIEDAMISRAEDRAQEQLSLKGGASFHRGNSKQDYGTPWEFIKAVELKFETIAFDLAANSENQKGPRDCYFGLGANSLTESWSDFRGLLWLNPPFSNIEPWAAKCRSEAEKGARILFLVPASVGSCWFQMHVHDYARVYFLRPRLSFDGVAPFPKDCVLCHYSKDVTPAYKCWKWK